MQAWQLILGWYHALLNEMAWLQHPISPDGGVVLMGVMRFAVGFMEFAFMKRAQVGRPALAVMASVQILGVVTASIAPPLTVIGLIANVGTFLYFFLTWRASRDEGPTPAQMRETIVRQAQTITDQAEDLAMYRAKYGPFPQEAA